MKKIPLLPLIVGLFLVLLTRLALAADGPPAPDVDAAAWAKLVYAAFTSHSWSVLSGLVLIALVYPLRRFGPDVFKSSLGGKILAFLVSLFATLGSALAVNVPVSLGLVASSLSTAVVAAGLWEWLKDHIPGVQSAADKSSIPAQLPVARTMVGKMTMAASSVVTEAFVVMKGDEIDTVFINADSNENNAELASEQRAAQIAAASFDNPQAVARAQAAWIARAPVNP